MAAQNIGGTACVRAHATEAQAKVTNFNKDLGRAGWGSMRQACFAEIHAVRW